MVLRIFCCVHFFYCLGMACLVGLPWQGSHGTDDPRVSMPESAKALKRKIKKKLEKEKKKKVAKEPADPQNVESNSLPKRKRSKKKYKLPVGRNARKEKRKVKIVNKKVVYVEDGEDPVPKSKRNITSFQEMRKKKEKKRRMSNRELMNMKKKIQKLLIDSLICELKR
ncbi:MAG: hypothetical protein AAF335_01820 [Bacteroidota bacterium]